MKRCMFFRTLHTYSKSFSGLLTKIFTLTVISTCISLCLWTVYLVPCARPSVSPWEYPSEQTGKIQNQKEAATLIEHLTCTWYLSKCIECVNSCHCQHNSMKWQTYFTDDGKKATRGYTFSSRATEVMTPGLKPW